MKKIKIKFINHLMKHGKKTVCEKIFRKSVKELQKVSFKQTKEIFKISILNAIPVFKLHTLTKKKRRKKRKKEIPVFIKNNDKRISIAIKFIINSVRIKKFPTFTNLTNEIILNSQTSGDSIILKQNLQKSVLKIQHLFKYYKW